MDSGLIGDRDSVFILQIFIESLLYASARAIVVIKTDIVLTR